MWGWGGCSLPASDWERFRAHGVAGCDTAALPAYRPDPRSATRRCRRPWRSCSGSAPERCEVVAWVYASLRIGSDQSRWPSVTNAIQCKAYVLTTLARKETVMAVSALWTLPAGPAAAQSAPWPQPGVHAFRWTVKVIQRAAASMKHTRHGRTLRGSCRGCAAATLYLSIGLQGLTKVDTALIGRTKRPPAFAPRGPERGLAPVTMASGYEPLSPGVSLPSRGSGAVRAATSAADGGPLLTSAQALLLDKLRRLCRSLSLGGAWRGAQEPASTHPLAPPTADIPAARTAPRAPSRDRCWRALSPVRRSGRFTAAGRRRERCLCRSTF